ncbi:SAF domain-containing protein [Kibdelosporangium philippinense]|uniref:SAF domain-containing protein n=1 Tax=Kibdelosporangium philippinense TaxID=211113 RepID=A0ABS8ZVK6_9PSEU|nr:SAF domain-containing protein [Kibdelosporangium philippinense]MCE7011732.1 SAF domain-containing protein [Kibdelosporangium philippinense]
MTTTAGSASTDTTTKDRTSPNAWAGRDGKAPSRLSGGGRRRSVPYLLLGVLLVVVCAAGGVFAGMQLGDRQSVLALARPVAVGQVLTAQDLKEVSMAADSGMDVMPASSASTVVGQPVAFSLPAGSLVTRSVLGAPQVPVQGKAIAAVGLKPGQFPPDLSPGTTVAVLTTPGQGTMTGTSAGSGQTSSWTAVVTGIATRETEQTTVVSLQLSESDARALASAPAGQLSLVAIAGGGR